MYNRLKGFGLHLRSSMLHVILIHSFNPHCRLCLRPEERVWIRVSCRVTTALKLNPLCLSVRTRVCVGLCVCVCVCVVSQNAPCGRARPWASVRRVCARLSPLCPLKRCRPRLSSFSRSVSPPLSPLTPISFVLFHFLFAPLSFISSLLFCLVLTVRVCSRHHPSYSSLSRP